MTVTDISKDLDAMTMTVTCEFAAPIARVWALWSDPRQLERWWGPPTYPATFVDHDLTPGGHMGYYMTSPEGEKYHGWWNILTVDEPNGFTLEDGFADADGAPNPEMPTTKMALALRDLGDGRTEMVMSSRFASREAMEQLLAMGMEEGLTAALGQIEAIFAD
jgi:uncharacterized protein YndB with AHSA1/START domain